MIDICIIGGGASGMVAAISVKEAKKDLSVVMIEKKDALGKKILATGNGRCNLSNVGCDGYRDTLEFFQDIGVTTRVDDAGRIYPYTEDAADLNGCLMRKVRSLEVEVITGAAVTGVDRRQDSFEIRTEENKNISAKKLLIACGGKAGPKFGTTGDGYKLAKALGHSVTRLAPALTAVELEDDVSDLAGIRAKAKVILRYKDEEIFEEYGEVQFTRYGISGICIFDMSRFMVLPEGMDLKDGFADYRISIDFFPKGGDLAGFIKQRIEKNGDGPWVLATMVKEPIAKRIYEKTNGEPKAMADMLQDFVLRPKGLKGWDFAQVTKGGIPLNEIDMETMESRITKGLFFAGEIIDYDGPCGGYNLQNAWETGIKAGRGMSV